jgi:glycerol-3-phosphate dehydrogenase subunit C
MIDIRESLDGCVKCTVCETFCPVAAVTPLFPGPKYAGPQSERFRTAGATVDASLDYCSGCGICTQVCPQDVHIAEINAQARAEMKAEHGMPVRDQVIARPTVLAALSRPIAPLANLSLELAPFRIALEKTLRIHRNAPLPKYSVRSFQSWARKHPRPANPKGTVVYFHGCAANSNEPWLAKMTVAVLEHNGYRVVVPSQGCCGLPLQSNGNFVPARKYLRALVAKLAPHAKKGATIVATSTSCGLMLKREGREMLGVDDPDLKLVGEHTFDICEFLLDLHDRGELRTDFAPLPLKVPYHQPCQGRGHGFGKPALDLLGLIPELDVIEVDHACCGIAGTYGLKAEKYDIAMEVGAPLFADIIAHQPDVSACDSETCRWQISKATDIPSLHPVELLHRAYGLPDPR